jgi:hypothetical protein
MAIDRLRSPFANNIITSGLAPENWAYANTSTGDVTPYTFVGDGTAGTVNGGIYRVHRWDYTATQTGWGITFNQAGIIDLLVCGGGAGGRGGYTTGTYSSAGGGAGGLILQFDYGVTATTYNVAVGKGGQFNNLGDHYYDVTNYAPEDSTFGALTAVAGGRGGLSYTTPGSSYSGGSGGGGSAGTPHTGPTAGGSGTSGQGNPGGAGSGQAPQYSAGGGGGYLTQGGDASTTAYIGGDGGDGLANYRFDGFSRGYAAGGGGAAYSNGTGGAGGAGGGGAGPAGAGQPGGDGSGVGCGGGGASGNYQYGGKGSHGMVIVRYRIG